MTCYLPVVDDVGGVRDLTMTHIVHLFIYLSVGVHVGQVRPGMLVLMSNDRVAVNGRRRPAWRPGVTTMMTTMMNDSRRTAAAW